MGAVNTVCDKSTSNTGNVIADLPSTDLHEGICPIKPHLFPVESRGCLDETHISLASRDKYIRVSWVLSESHLFPVGAI